MKKMKFTTGEMANMQHSVMDKTKIMKFQLWTNILNILEKKKNF